MTKEQRRENLLPNGQPRYVRCYDSGPDGTFDRYTVVFTGNYASRTDGMKLSYSMSGNPTHPQGCCFLRETDGTAIDRPFNGYPPQIGKHAPTLGERVEFSFLPVGVVGVALNMYKDIWRLW